MHIILGEFILFKLLIKNSIASNSKYVSLPDFFTLNGSVIINIFSKESLHALALLAEANFVCVCR